MGPSYAFLTYVRTYGVGGKPLLRKGPLGLTGGEEDLRVMKKKAAKGNMEAGGMRSTFLFFLAFFYENES